MGPADYDLRIDEAISTIRQEKAKRVLLQLPDGLKPKAAEIQRAIRKETDTEVLIWAGSCFGACDRPVAAKNMGCDLVIQWGHARWS
ncbi:diphthamide synthesis protein [Candidatus Woesearchaeota archaeon]|nr:diphthamide synthesis protein [Candidatus Woesearchaeota archaeon]